MDRAPKILSREDFGYARLWKYDDIDDVFLPVFCPDQLPEDTRDLRIFARFTFANGSTIDGYISGISNVFSICLFVSDCPVRFNRNITGELFHREFQKIIRYGEPPTDLRPSDVFPMIYETEFGWSERGFNDFKGEFNHPGH